ncbi:hypothetical protein GOBAR_DD20157 [Gossypium barbadense]|nr:hypothetical protein GOBAR_DD20157 [Gossypium barbadense]
MRLNRNVSFDDMKEMISAKIVRRCGRRISKLFYKFPVSTNPIKFTEMELIDDENVKTMIALYCRNRSDQNVLILLFAELAGVETTEDFTAFGEEHGAEESCMVAPISYVDSESTIRRIDIYLNVAPDINVVGDDRYDSSDPCDQEVDSDSDPDMDEVPDDIEDECVNDDGNINAPHMLLMDPDAVHIVEFLEYPEILPSHWLAVDSDPEELFIGQRFESKEECVFSIKRGKELIIAIRRCGVPWRSVYCIRHIATNFHRDYKNADWWRQVVRMAHELEPHIFCQRITRLENDMADDRDAMVANRWMTRSINVEVYSRRIEMLRVMETIGHRLSIPPRFYGVDLQKKLYDCRRFQTLHYPCAHVMAVYAKVVQC